MLYVHLINHHGHYGTIKQKDLTKVVNSMHEGRLGSQRLDPRALNILAQLVSMDHVVLRVLCYNIALKLNFDYVHSLAETFKEFTCD